MSMLRVFSYSILVLCGLFPNVQTEAQTTLSPRIGILGDIHFRGDTDDFLKSIRSLRAENLTHLIVTGDVTHRGDSTHLAEALKLLAETVELPPQRLFFQPGNREIFSRHSNWPESRKAIEKYVTVLQDDANQWAELQIGDQAIFVSHFPLFDIPEEGRGSIIEEFNLRFWRDEPTTRSEIARNQFPPTRQPSLIVVGHTHRALVWKTMDGHTVVNPGALQASTEESSFAIFDSLTREVRFLDRDGNRLYEIPEIDDFQGSLFPNACLRVFRRLPKPAEFIKDLLRPGVNY
jgi:predicted phosphodiesterase